MVCLKAIFVFFGVSLWCSSSLAIPTIAIKTFWYSHAIVRSYINTIRPLPSSNYRHRAKLHLTDLLNLIKSQDFIDLSPNLLCVWPSLLFILEVY